VMCMCVCEVKWSEAGGKNARTERIKQVN